MRLGISRIRSMAAFDRATFCRSLRNLRKILTTITYRKMGPASLKTVLPILTELRYDNLDIQDGDLAQREFLRITFHDVPREERLKVRRALEKYCAQDTGGLIALLESLKTVVAMPPEGSP